MINRTGKTATVFILSMMILFTASCGPSGKSDDETSNQDEITSQFLKLEPFTYNQTLTTTGRLSANQDLVIKSKLSENVDDILVPEGHRVSEGQKLLQMDTRQLTIRRNRARYRMSRAEHELTISRRDYERKQNLLAKELISQREFDQSKLEYQRARENYRISQSNFEDAKLQLSYTSVTSPIDGYLEAHHVEPGERVQPGQPLLRVLGLDPLDVKFFVNQDERPYLSVGDSVTVTLTNGNQKRKGTIEHISRDVSKKNKLYEVVASLPNSDMSIPAGQTVQLETPLRTIQNVVEIPLEYVDREKESPRLILMDPEDNSIHVRQLEPIDYKQEIVLVKADWPGNWKLIPGGVYSSATGLSQ